MSEARYISAKEAAQLARADLKTAFPGVKFSVRSDSNSLWIGWVDGPTEYEVDQFVAVFRGASFDGMIDLLTLVDSTYKGERVRFGSKYISTVRTFSRAFLTRIAERVAAEYNLPAPAILGSDVDCFCENSATVVRNHFTLSDVIHQKARRTKSVVAATR